LAVLVFQQVILDELIFLQEDVQALELVLALYILERLARVIGYMAFLYQHQEIFSN